jgi:rRNA processing protein Krr1/Pno1
LRQAQDWQKQLGDFENPNAARVLNVEIGCERLRLNGVASSEEAIARIEQRLRGKSPTGKITEPQAPWRM